MKTRHELKDRIRKLMDEIDDHTTLAFNIAATGLSVGLIVFLLTVVLVRIYYSPGLGYMELIGMVGGALLAAVASWTITTPFRDDMTIKLNPMFWVMAFLMGGGILAQYAETPDAIFTLQNMFMAACVIAFPAIVWDALFRVLKWFERPIKAAEKQKNERLQTDEVAGAMQRLADDGQIAGRIVLPSDDLPGKFHTDQPERKMWYEY